MKKIKNIIRGLPQTQSHEELLGGGDEVLSPSQARGLSASSQELREWLQKFEAKNGRKLRVLHVGNIAANGFLNAKFLRRIGVETDVLCNDYYHIMGYPEWEELYLNDGHKQDILPRFSKRDRGSYERPKWFVQGPISSCFDYLHAKNSGQQEKADRLWEQLNSFLFHEVTKVPSRLVMKTVVKKGLRYTRNFGLTVLGKGWQAADYCLFQRVPSLQPLKLKIRNKARHSLYQLEIKTKAILNNTSNTSTASNQYQQQLEAFVQHLNKKYLTTFPDRQFQLEVEDVEHYYRHKEDWEKIAEFYDVVQFYGTHPIYGLLFAKKSYVGFEHGTLRTFTSDNTALDALTALSYKFAKHVFITNGDCLEYAERLQMNNFSPMIHPIDVEQHRTRNENRIKKLRMSHQAEILLFCPLRHDWDIKGTDKHIRALPHINAAISKKVVLVMTNWGADLEKSQALAKSLGVDDQIVWISPLCRLKMIELIQASDVVLDQTILPCFGSTAPQALACGTPTIMSYKPEVTEWLIKEPAPLICATNEIEIAEGIQTALDKAWLADFKIKAQQWIDHFHSSNVAIDQQIKAYKDFLEG
jgi:glycosyltransferase involved in cell wall biosynthesis